MQPVIYRFRDYNITIAFLFKHELRQMYKYKYKCSLVKNLLIH